MTFIHSGSTITTVGNRRQIEIEVSEQATTRWKYVTMKTTQTHSNACMIFSVLMLLI